MLMTAVHKLIFQLVVVVSWIIELRNRFPWYDKTPPSSLDFKLWFVVTGQLYDMNRRVSNPCFSSCFREYIAYNNYDAWIDWIKPLQFFILLFICYHLALLINLGLSSNRDCWHEFCQPCWFLLYLAFANFIMLATAMHIYILFFCVNAGSLWFACSLVIIVNIAARIKLLVREIIFFFGVWTH